MKLLKHSTLTSWVNVSTFLMQHPTNCLFLIWSEDRYKSTVPDINKLIAWILRMSSLNFSVQSVYIMFLDIVQSSICWNKNTLGMFMISKIDLTCCRLIFSIPDFKKDNKDDRIYWNYINMLTWAKWYESYFQIIIYRGTCDMLHHHIIRKTVYMYIHVHSDTLPIPRVNWLKKYCMRYKRYMS